MGDRDGGVMFVGEKGKIICGCYARNPKFLPRDKFDGYEPVINERLVPEGINGHEKDWLRACKEKPEAAYKRNLILHMQGHLMRWLLWERLLPDLQD